MRLWDGKFYCQECVAGESAALLDQAQRSNHYREQVQVSDWMIASSTIKLCAITVFCIASVVALLALITRSAGFALGLFFLFLGIGFCFVPLWAAVEMMALRSQRPALTACDGQLMVQCGCWVTDVALMECVGLKARRRR